MLRISEWSDSLLLGCGMCSKSVARVMIAMALLIAVAAAVTKKPPDLSGKWRLNRELSTADPRFMKDDSMIVTQKGNEVKFAYFIDDKADGAETIVVDGIDHRRYVTRIERAYARASWGNEELVIRTKHVMDDLGYQFYDEIERWVLSANHRTLVNQLPDGKKIVWEWEGPPPDDLLAAVQDFRAVGVNSGKPEGTASKCRLQLAGPLKGEKIGAGKYNLCMAEVTDLPQQTDLKFPPVSGGCTPLGGTLHFTSDDGVSALALNISGQYCANTQAFLGTYNLDPSSVTGKFSKHVNGGSGMMQFSSSTNAIVLNGALLFH
jgi:hypothetical protein